MAHPSDSRTGPGTGLGTGLTHAVQTSRHRAGDLLTRLVQGLLLLLAAGELVWAVLVLVLNLASPSYTIIPVGLAPGVDPLWQPPTLPDVASLQLPDQGNAVQLSVDGASRPLHLLALAPGVVGALATAAVALMAARLLRTAREGRPFDPRNPRRLTVIAWAVLAGGGGGAVLDRVARSTVLHQVGLDGPNSPVVDRSTLDLKPLIGAVVVFALAEAFRRGRRLAEDTAGLV